MFAMSPWPSMMNIFFHQGKREFTNKFAQITTQGHLFFQPFEENNLERIKTVHAEVFQIYKNSI